jgi:hypothetical protein
MNKVNDVSTSIYTVEFYISPFEDDCLIEAVSEEDAEEQLMKRHPNSSWADATKLYNKFCYVVYDGDDRLLDLYESEDRAETALMEYQNTPPNTEFCGWVGVKQIIE